MRWLVFIASFIVGGLSFPAMFWRKDEWPLLKKAADLTANDGNDDPSDGLDDAWARLKEPGLTFHDLKNIGHEWVKANPKVAFKGFGFVLIVLVVIGAAT